MAPLTKGKAPLVFPGSWIEIIHSNQRLKRLRKYFASIIFVNFIGNKGEI